MFSKFRIIQVPTLPKVLFAENFDNRSKSMLSSLLKTITPELKKLGYGVFYDGNSGSKTLEQQLQVIKQKERLYQSLKQDFARFHLDPKNKKDIHAYFSIQSILLTKDKDEAEKKEYQTVTDLLAQAREQTMHFYDDAIHYQNLYETLQRKKIQFKGMDYNIVSENNSAAFGKLSLVSIANIQRQIPAGDADRFYFINAYANDSILLEERDFPLGMTSLEVTAKNEDKVIRNILNKIEEKKERISDVQRKIQEVSVTEKTSYKK